MRSVYVSNLGTAAIYGYDLGQNGELGTTSGSPFTTLGSSVGIGMTPNGAYLYGVTNGNNVEAFKVGADGALSTVTGSPFASSGGPQYIAVTPSGNRLYVATSSQGIWAYNIASDGSLTPVTGSPFVPGTSVVDLVMAPDGGHVYTIKPGAASLTTYAIGANGALTAAGSTTAAGANAQGIALTPDGLHLYVSNNVATNNLSAFTIASNGSLSAVPGSPFTAGSLPGRIATTPDGRHLYASNLAADTVTGMDISADGSLSAMPGPAASAGEAGSIGVTPDSAHLYVADYANAGGLAGFNVTSAGALSVVLGSPYGTGSFPGFVVVTPNQAPIAGFSSPPTVTRSVSFNAETSSDPDGTVARYDWDFGDGSTLPNGGPTPIHDYAVDGAYTAKLTVTDNEGCSTSFVSTGHTASCNGGPSATANLSVTAVTAGTPDTSVDGASLNAKKTQKQGKKIVVKFNAGAAEAVTLAAKGKIKAGRKSYALKRLTKPATAGKTVAFKLKLKSSKSSPPVSRALGGKVKASVTVTFTDETGNSATKKASVALKG
jgi:6-phosphogluconolactonase (cycloisomerase 2 family)